MHPSQREQAKEEEAVMSIGAQRVRLSFNPSSNQEVEAFKVATAALIDACELLKDKNARLAALAQTAYEEACMWAVKAATSGTE